MKNEHTGQRHEDASSETTEGGGVMLNGVELKAADYNPKKLGRNFYRNVKRCCRLLEINVYDLELEAGVSTGYLSRIGNRGQGADMLMSNALKFSKLLRLPIETLVMDMSEAELIKQLEKASVQPRRKRN